MTAKLTPQEILDQKYTVSVGRALMSGSQALVRLPMLQQERDQRAGLNTAGFISGYRGSPLSGFDQQLWNAEKHLKVHNVVFKPGVNEDLAATAVWGTQQVNLSDKAQYDGVFSMWYGKGPGVDRSMDAIKHANSAGTSKHGGVLMVAGDDHAAKSSTLAHQSEHDMAAAGVPVLYPSNVQEFIDFGLHGWAMSRYSGLWVGLKCVTQVLETTATIELDPERNTILLPQDYEMPEGGLNLRWPDPPLVQEARLLQHKWYAALAYIRANKLNRVVIDSPKARFGIMAAGKAYQDVRQALDDLGLNEEALSELGVRVMKVGCVWPLDAQDARRFAQGLDEILVVEEKRQILEYALKEELYNWREDVRPKVYGKFDARGDAGGEWSVPRADWLLPATAELSSSQVALAIAKRLRTMDMHDTTRRYIDERLAIIEGKEREAARPRVTTERTPWFCSGCPHNTSTKVPEGSRALAGIGCHYMVQWMDRDTATFSHMGGEGAAWIGQSPFLDEEHVFVNLGDGTYFHSGLLAIRAAVGAEVNITYKILFNEAIAMTGGQPVDGSLTVPQLAQQVIAEGVTSTVIVSDYPKDLKALHGDIPEGVDVFHRDELDEVQKTLRETTGTTVLIYQQMCATEKRRRRKRGTLPTVDKHVVINTDVCEGCGDCSQASNCLSIEPVETPFGTKRRINHSTCNQDFSCVKGFCPSFVTVEGATLRKPEGAKQQEPTASKAQHKPETVKLQEAKAKVLDTAAATSKSVVDESLRSDNADQATGANVNTSSLQSNGSTGKAVPQLPADLPEPTLPPLDQPARILITGVGGTGVVTVGALLTMAAHLDGREASVLDMSGLAQKGGAVLSHVQIASDKDALHASRIAMGEATLLLGCDAIVSASNEALSRTLPELTRAVINNNRTPTAEFVLNRDWAFPGDSVVEDVERALGENAQFIDANTLALKLLGNTLYANALLIGYAWQSGCLPLRRESLLEAMRINGTAVDANQQAFEWGRYIAHHGVEVCSELLGDNSSNVTGTGVETATATSKVANKDTQTQVVQFHPRNSATSSADNGINPETHQQIIDRYTTRLTGYQSAKYAKRYQNALANLETRERTLNADESLPLTAIAAQQLGKLMAYKDEYEVARLYSQPEFLDQLRQQFEGEPGEDYQIRLNMAPPLFSKKDAQGHLKKKEYGRWLLKAMPKLAAMKRLRGTPLDVFGHTQERRQERTLIKRYQLIIERVADELNTSNQDAMRDLLMLPDQIRGFGHVKAAAIEKFETAYKSMQ